jgi:hypothetical protein
MKQGQFPAILNLTDLNGKNGFKLDGEASGDGSGVSVSTAGDINGDGVSDLLIGASYANYTGRSYVVYGGASVGSSGTIALSSLTGVNGFKLNGENNNDYSGSSVSAAGDINGDGIADLLIGAPDHAGQTGRSYVVFSGLGVGSSGLVALSGLNGSMGFKLDGEATYDVSSWSVSAARDINGDGVSDLLIGAPQHAISTGRSYVVFGGPGVGGSGLIALSTLNGSNGFSLDGEATSNWSGLSVSGVGDVNGDGFADMLIGAPGHAGQTGRSYVVFGGHGVGSSGLMALSGLNVSTGFKLDGEEMGDQSGFSVSAAGDVNGDGFADLLIGAYGPVNETGRSYVVFGGLGVGGSGLLALSGLDGRTGFKLDGEAMHDRSGYSVSTAGDINGDGVSDLLIGASDSASGTGRSYVVFGGQEIGSSGLIMLSELNGSTGFKLDGEAPSDWSGHSVSAAGDINSDGVSDLLIGAYGHANYTGRSYVVFGDIPPVLVNNSLSLSVGATINLNSTFLAATDRNHQNNTLVFIPSAVEHGQFEAVGAPGIPLNNFTQQQVIDGSIQFVHDGTLVAPRYDITVRSSGIAWVGPLAAKINFIGTPPSYFPAVLPLSSLNGQNGFKLDGEKAGDTSGWAVAAAGDINGDGYTDLLIGAYCYPTGNTKGRTYVVFGGPGVGSSGNILLGSLNGANGFKLDGENNNDLSGYAISIGEINGDNYADILIGGEGYPGGAYKGRSYVVFGGPGVGSSGDILLGGLNGTNGFKLDGENNGDCSGRVIRPAGDFNGDGYTDLLIPSARYLSGKGRSYVVFGGPGIGSNGDILLGSLNGANGFKLDGENNNDSSGNSVDTAGDINGDGYVDILIAADGYPAGSGKGRSYVVFGGPKVGSSGDILLGSLNGTNGFKLDGENNNDHSGYFVSAVGDINGDGYVDILIGADGYPAGSGKGRSYVVFGGPGVGSGGDILLGSLNGANGFKLDGENNNDISGISVSMAGDINNDGVVDLLVGASGYANGTGRTYVVFGDIPPVLVNNRLSLSGGATTPLSATFLAAIDRNHLNDTLVFYPTNVTHGYFESMSQPGIPLTNFTQPQLQNNTIQFVHDGSVFTPSYNITVRSAGIAWTGPYPANITFVPSTTPTPTPTLTPTVTPTPTPASRAPIVLVNNQLTLSNGNQVILSPAQLQATEAGYNNSQLEFLISNIQNGYFTLTGKNTTRLTAFNQSQIEDGEILFVATNPNQSPAYAVMVTDGVQYTVPDNADVYLAGAPVITQNTVTLQLGETVTLTPTDLNVTVSDSSTAAEIICQVSDVQHAIFTQLPSGAAITNFTLSDIQAGRVQVTQDGSNIAPTYLLSCGGKTGVSSAPVTVITQFSDHGVFAPQIVNNNLFITQGSTVVLNSQNVDALQNSTQPLSPQAKFFVSEVQHGYFSIASLPGFIANAFTQSQLHNGSVQFTQDNSLSPPSYRLTVLALGLESASLPASIFFRPVNQPPKLVHSLADQTATVGQPFTYAIPVDSFVDPEGESLTFSINRFNSSLSLPDWLHFNGLDNRFTGTPTVVDFIPVNVTAQDPEGLAASSDFTINVAAPPSDSSLSTWQRTIIGAMISGGIGIGFALVQICMKRLANKKLMQVLGAGDSTYEQDVVRPVMKEIAQRIKITGCMNATTNKELMAFKSAVRSLLSELKRRQVDLNFEEMKESQRDEIINEIGHQTYRWMKGNQRGCGKCCPGLHSFFKPQLTAEKLQEGVAEIADQIAQKLGERIHPPQSSLSRKLSVSGSPVYKAPQDRRSVELLEIDSPSQQQVIGSERQEESLVPAIS